MGKLAGKMLVFAFGAGVALYGAESATPGSSKPVTAAAVSAADGVIVGGGEMLNTGVQTVIPVASNAFTSLKNSGVGSLLTPDTTAPTTDNTVPPADVPPATQKKP